MPLTTSVLYDDGVALISLAGQLDLTVVALVDAAVSHVLDDGVRRVLLDLDALGFCDSTGLGALLRASHRVREAGGTCVVAAARGPVQRLLDLAAAERTLQTSPDVQPALVRLRQRAPETLS